MKAATICSYHEFSTERIEAQVVEDTSFLASLLEKVVCTKPDSLERKQLVGQLALGFVWVLKRIELGCYDGGNSRNG